MSKLDELIAELCPDGVEYKTIGEIATDMYRGAGITRDQVTDDGIPCVRYGEIYTTYGVWSKPAYPTRMNPKYQMQNILSMETFFLLSQGKA